MASRKNGDIRGFFKSAGPSSSQTQSQPTPSPPAPSDPFPFSDLPSSPRTPPKSTPRVFSRDDEIKGSDDSEDESDDSLGSITGALGYRSGPVAHRRDPDVLATPQAKRIASAIHRSPLTLQPKKHRFDLKALISHSREIERTEESIRQAGALIAQAEKNSDKSDDSDVENDPKRLEEAASHLFVGPDDEGKGDKLRRAFKRSKKDEASSRKHCYFFNHEESPLGYSNNTFPRKKATGRWKCLSQSDTRRRAFIAGVPHTFLAQGEALPDELFRWVINEICTEQNGELRRQYVNLTELCKDNTNRLVDDVWLYAMLEGIGGPRRGQEHSKLESTAEVRYGYLERNRSPLVAFLQLLGRIAPNLQTTSAVGAVQLLLRMSLDPIIATVVRDHHMCAITALVSNLARHKPQWNTACNAICSYIYEHIDDLELKVTAISSIPSSNLHLVDLRRRIAAESLFNVPGLGSKPPDSYLSFERIRNRLDEGDFKSTNRINFDFEHLRALTTLLDIVIDRADFMRPATNEAGDSRHRSSSNSNSSSSGSSAATRGATTPDDAAAKEQNFNAEIDVLATRIKIIHDKIRDKASRKNVKLGLLGLEKRLRYAVRTRPPPRKEIFASEPGEPDTNVPRQRDFMRQWALKKKERQDGEESVPGTSEFSDDRRQGAAKNLQVDVG